MKSLRSWLVTPCVLLAGCAHGLLPRAGADATSGFKTFGEAQAAFVQIVPRRTTTAELTRIGFDIAAPNDLLNFDRITAVDSWRFEALVVVRGEVVLFHTYDEPRNQRIERERYPLGPL
jgi:outer membrane lipoprotein-sorting protein